jgi:spoIIIJ-associated protein
MKIPSLTVEVIAKDLDEAKRIAAEKLNVSINDLLITILEETKRLFGKSQVRVKAEVKPPVESTVESQQDIEEEVSKEQERTETTQPASEEQAEIVVSQEDVENVLVLTTEALEKSHLNARVRFKSIVGHYVHLELYGTDVSYIVGDRGEPLNSLQFLVNLMYTKKFGSGVRVVLDGNDFRKSREKVLQKLAMDIAEQVLKRGEEAVLDALPAFERRVIHKALQNYKGVTTYSEGEEPNRRVVIAPV